jgi:hypothetical protein
MPAKILTAPKSWGLVVQQLTFHTLRSLSSPQTLQRPKTVLKQANTRFPNAFCPKWFDTGTFGSEIMDSVATEVNQGFACGCALLILR